MIEPGGALELEATLAPRIYPLKPKGEVKLMKCHGRGTSSLECYLQLVAAGLRPNKLWKYKSKYMFNVMGKESQGRLEGLWIRMFLLRRRVSWVLILKTAKNRQVFALTLLTPCRSLQWQFRRQLGDLKKALNFQGRTEQPYHNRIGRCQRDWDSSLSPMRICLGSSYYFAPYEKLDTRSRRSWQSFMRFLFISISRLGMEWNIPCRRLVHGEDSSTVLCTIIGWIWTALREYNPGVYSQYR